ncbi:hypothetical protein [Ramlibacter sp.]|uniref:hypothetical protein n=1 Tax=Ramlibacter sp. TaxID=1917967 RepID=UPI002BBB01FE|nr:hypothetical protein [Ramlibacter sp.]HWI81063.1 hypothetical protein [Ramlibacter sp.]
MVAQDGPAWAHARAPTRPAALRLRRPRPADDATAQISGQAFQACWVIDGQTARLVYEDGDEGLVPLSEFKKPA